MGLRVLWWLVGASAADPWAYGFCGGYGCGASGKCVVCYVCAWTCLDLPGLAWTYLAQLPIACISRFAVVAYLPRMYPGDILKKYTTT